jgi:hypothetical protein
MISNSSPLTSLQAIETWPHWKRLKSLLLSSLPIASKKSYRHLDSYDLVHVWVDDNGDPLVKKFHAHDVESCLAFTSENLARRCSRTYSLKEFEEGAIDHISARNAIKLKLMMLGELVSSLDHLKHVTPIKVNPIMLGDETTLEPFLFCEDVLFAPLFDQFTKKHLLTDPAEAKALLAISAEDQERFGISLVFSMLTNRTLPDEKERREAILQDKLEEMVFTLPRIPMKRGSGTFIAVLLNLDNDWEESAFIRDYGTFDSHTDVVFVTSGLKMLTGKLEEIPYDGEVIDTIFLPLIRWQNRSRRLKD